jgi:uncharacterized protein
VLERTFVHVPGVGLPIEKHLWEQGCLNWDDFLTESTRYSSGHVSQASLIRHLEESKTALSKRDGDFFRQGLGLKEAWRAFPEFRDKCVYLDIETDGGNSGASITTIGMYDGSYFKCLIQGKDLDDFPEIMAEYAYVVTFYGSGFDIPMLQKRFREMPFRQIHLDLCPTLRRLGYRGGLKKIEKQLGLSRGDDTDGLDGRDAILLWRRYKALGEEEALETLIAYNREDVVNMEYLAEVAYKGLREQILGA